MSHQPTEESFLKDVAEHQMHVLMDNGVYRHLRFKAPGTMIEHFDIITYPGYLVYSGDMGCYVFYRLTDMFQFFRTDREYLSNGKTLGINLGYWSEKLQAVDGNRHESSVMEYSEELFRDAVKDYFDNWVSDREPTDKEKQELWDDLESCVLSYADEGEHKAIEMAMDYRADKADFEMTDFYERTLREYTCRFVWCCYALAWGIQQYDKANEAKEAA